MEYYILQGKRAIATDCMTWWAWYQNNNRRVAYDKFGHVAISTVFLGLNHAWCPSQLEIFETMIFGGEHDQECWRYATWEEAEAGHEAAVRLVIESRYNTIKIHLKKNVNHEKKIYRVPKGVSR